MTKNGQLDSSPPPVSADARDAIGRFASPMRLILIMTNQSPTLRTPRPIETASIGAIECNHCESKSLSLK